MLKFIFFMLLACAPSVSDAKCAKDEHCLDSASGHLETFDFIGYLGLCRGVDWKSKNQDRVSFELEMPDHDVPARDRSAMLNLTVGDKRLDPISLKDKKISCGKTQGTLDWDFKEIGKQYSTFKMNSTCGSEVHAIEAICVEVKEVEVQPKETESKQ